MKLIISNTSPSPIYEQIAAQIKAQIIAGELVAGAPLPSIRRLAKELQISVITSKRAYDELEKEGFIDTVGGKGCFVAAQSTDFLREKRLQIIEEKLAEAITEAKTIGLGLPELVEIVTLIYQGEE